jgi:Ca2+/H+ antiporter, TMEM165/GDT1 family
MTDNPRHFKRKKRRFFGILFIPLFIILVGTLVMLLWNAVLPPLALVGRIGFWQAVGLFLLCRILFGGFRFRRPNERWGYGGPGNAWQSRWQNMTDEDRARFREKLRQRCRDWKQQKKEGEEQSNK